MTPAKILVVDDEPTLCDVLKLNLNIEGFDVDISYSAEDALERNLSEYDLIILDVMMGGMNGFEFMSWIRNDARLANIPVILCTAKSEEKDRIEGLLRGADDYVCKPFSMKELMLRVKGVLRRSSQHSSAGKIMVDMISIDPYMRVCMVGNEPIELTRKEFDLLYTLLVNKGKVMSREDILSQVWDDDVYVVDRSVDVTINRVRKKIGRYAERIVTKHGYGYGFI